MSTDPSQRLEFLLQQGFTEYQGRAYLALLQYASCTVGELSRASGLPRNRLYEVLTDLQTMGLVQVRPETPRRYRARPLADHLRLRAETLRQQASVLEDELHGMDAKFAPPPENGEALSVGSTRILQGRRAVAQEIDRLFEDARESVHVVSSTSGLDRVVGYVRQGLEVRRMRGLPPVAVGLIVPSAVKGSVHLTEAEHHFTGGITIVDADLRLTSFILDDNELLTVQAMPEDPRLRMGEDFALLTTNPAIVHDALTFLRLVGHHTTHPS